MYKRIDKGELKIKFWSDGYDNDPFHTATHIVMQVNHPDDPEVESESDYFVIDQSTNTTYLYAKSMVVRRDRHNHFHFNLLSDFFDDVKTGNPVTPNDTKEFILGILQAKDFTVQFADPDDLPSLGLDVTVPRNMDDLNQHALEGYGFNATTDVPVFTFLVSETAPPPVKWMPPLSHLINYTWHDPENNQSTQRLGVLDRVNETLGGWSGEEGYKLVQALTEHEEYEIAVQTVPVEDLPSRDPSGGFEPAFLGDIEYGLAETGYQQVEDSPWSDYRNDDGQTMLEMWQETMH